MFSELFKKLRSEKGLSQGQIAKKIGVSAGNISDWEAGKTKPGYTALYSIARFFDVSADYLLEIDAAPGKPGMDLSEAKQAQGLLCDGSPLTDEEADLIAMYRLLPSSQQEETFDFIYFKYQRFVEQKRGSIFSAYAGTERPQKSGSDGDETPCGTA